MTILVTGSSGFIARYLIPALSESGHSLVGLDPRPVETLFGGDFKYVEGSILDRDKIETALQGVDVVMHLAAEHQDFGVSEDSFHEVNVHGTQLLLESAADHQVTNFVFFSSVAVYGETTAPTHEELLPSPVTPYGASKLGAEQLVERWVGESEDRSALVIRPTVVFGPHNYANMYRLISQIANRRYLNVGKGNNIKSIGYVENLVMATVFLMKHMRPGLAVYNYADEPHLTSRQIASAIAEALGIRLPRVSIPYAPALALALPMDSVAAVTGWNVPVTAKRIRKYATSTHHLARKLADAGFTPEYSTIEGLQKTVEWFVSAGLPQD
jgi:nucleoside-diphosphate-sugar epimerase